MKQTTFDLEQFNKLNREMNVQKEAFLKLLKVEVFKRPYFEGVREAESKTGGRFTQGKSKTAFKCKMLCEGLPVDLLVEVSKHSWSHEYYSLEHIYVVCKELKIFGKEISHEGMHDFKIFCGRVEVCKVRVS